MSVLQSRRRVTPIRHSTLLVGLVLVTNLAVMFCVADVDHTLARLADRRA